MSRLIRQAADIGALLRPGAAAASAIAPTRVMQVCDLELLSRALRARLERAAGQSACRSLRMAAGGDGEDSDAGGEAPIDIAECLLDLDRLHALILQQAQRSQETIEALRSALAQAHSGEQHARRLALQGVEKTVGRCDRGFPESWVARRS